MGVYYVSNIPYSDELYHYGLKGMKWGIRRFQNEDGSLTPAGKERYGQGSEGGALKGNSKQSGGGGSIDKAKIKKALKIGAIAAGTALAAYGAYKLTTSDAFNEMMTRNAHNKALMKEAINVHKIETPELLDKIGRLDKELEFKEKVAKSIYGTIDPKQQIVRNAGKRVAETILGGAGIYGIKMLLTKQVNAKDAAQYITPPPKKK